MTWKHLVIEGYCLVNDETRKQAVSQDCTSPGEIGLHCLELCGGRRCPFFGYIQPGSTVILTDAEGNERAFSGFESEEINAQEWRKQEQAWIESWEAKIRNEREGQVSLTGLQEVRNSLG